MKLNSPTMRELTVQSEFAEQIAKYVAYAMDSEPEKITPEFHAWPALDDVIEAFENNDVGGFAAARIQLEKDFLSNWGGKYPTGSIEHNILSFLDRCVELKVLEPHLQLG